MEYQVRQTVRVTQVVHDDNGKPRRHINQVVHYLPARNKGDAQRIVDNLESGGTSDTWREHGDTFERSFDVVFVCYVSGGRKLVLSEEDITMIAVQSEPHKVAAE